MTNTIKERIEALEDESLASYAVHSQDSYGRKYNEDVSAIRSDFQRDRDRIIHSTAFRRLEYKTQVFLNHEGDHYRTRLTHTIEVVQVARTIAKVLCLNETLAEAIALAHDIGHTAFGHAGEDVLDQIMKSYGGFDHNFHGFRIVSLLEKRYPDFDGLNLTWEVREGFMKHKKTFQRAKAIDSDFNEQCPFLSLEAQVANIADEITYDTHDIDDGIRAGLISMESLSEVPMWSRIANRLKGAVNDKEIWRSMSLRVLMNELITGLIRHSTDRIKKSQVTSVAEVRKWKEPLVSFDDDIENDRMILKEFLVDNVYNHPKVYQITQKAKETLSTLFSIYLHDPQKLPDHVSGEINKNSKKELYQAICDYIAGMTDRYADKEYRRWGP
ncbi:deoxyguanosinetriphosphate triphosphohydrolase [PVC group bacterium]|nr:deoxyguanosinetriphosphate triphosphohydrolase [PVC group bacterium]